MPQSKDLSRQLELDVLRGFAALGVVFFHYTSNYALRFYTPEQSMLFLFPWGEYGVHLFFMISGFVILMTLEKTTRILDFIVSRFSRLYPCYWCAILLTALAIKQFLLLPSAQMQLPFKAIVINFSMLQSWFGVQDLDSVYWTLAPELLFYFLMAIVFLTKGMKYIELFGVLWLVIMVLNKYFGTHWPPVVFLQFVFTSLLKYGNLFVAGILFYGLKTKGNKWYRHLGIALCVLVQYLIWIDFRIQPIICFIFFVFIFYLFVMGRLSFIVKKPLIYFGTISYSLYLIHQNVGYIIIQWLFFFGHNSWLMFFVPTTCSLVLATLMTYIIEKPMMKLIRQTYKSFFLRRITP